METNRVWLIVLSLLVFWNVTARIYSDRDIVRTFAGTNEIIFEMLYQFCDVLDDSQCETKGTTP